MLIDVRKQCPFCGKYTTVKVEAEALDAYNKGINIAVALPNLSAFDREVMITGMCYDCQEKAFSKPAPGHEDLWGKVVGECDCCGASLYEKDIKGDKVICNTCGCRYLYINEQLTEVEDE